MDLTNLRPAISLSRRRGTRSSPDIASHRRDRGNCCQNRRKRSWQTPRAAPPARSRRHCATRSTNAADRRATATIVGRVEARTGVPSTMRVCAVADARLPVSSSTSRASSECWCRRAWHRPNTAGDVDRHVLVFRQAVEADADVAAQIQVEPPRFVEDQRVLVADERKKSLAANLGRTEHVVEIGVVQRHARPPVEAVVGRGEVHTFFGLQFGAGTVGGGNAKPVQLQRIGIIDPQARGASLCIPAGSDRTTRASCRRRG